MIEKILQEGFMALSAYMYIFTIGSFVLFVFAAIFNVFAKRNRFDIIEIRKMFFVNLMFTAVFAVMEYFLVL